MSTNTKLYTYQPDQVSFICPMAPSVRTLYFPLCGADEKSVKASITPYLSGDIKTDKNHYLTKPASTEDLRNNSRDFFVFINGRQLISLADKDRADESKIEAGPLWHKLSCFYEDIGFYVEALNFVPVKKGNVELMRIDCTNRSKRKMTIASTAFIPIFARALANKHDHEHVTSLLHRVRQLPEGVAVEPTMLFNEEGHSANHHVYFVHGFADKRQKPLGTFPTVESFIGESGTAASPQAVLKNTRPVQLQPENLNGREACGALRFKERTVDPGKTASYFVIIGIGEHDKDRKSTLIRFNSKKKFEAALVRNKAYWRERSRSVRFQTADDGFNAWMRWVTLQPIMRRIFGCSFLPDHDYGKGGKGWRDIWQDLLALIFIEPEEVGDLMVRYFAGVRVDGSNATIIGDSPGEFVADRNAITRVWMDHGVWPFLTLLLYIHQTGNHGILLKRCAYFKDLQLSRAMKKDPAWEPQQGKELKDRHGRPYLGTVLEHILVQHLVQFFNVGEHNNIRLEHADWNDGFDMAFERGESVAFSALYGGNLLALADLLEELSRKQDILAIDLAKEVAALLDTVGPAPLDYNDADAKRALLFDTYFPSVEPTLSGDQKTLTSEDVVRDLRVKGNWIFNHIRDHEKVGYKDYRWFNGYYDNNGEKLEGVKKRKPQMTLTGQVFPVMSGLADHDEIRDVVKAVNALLKDRASGNVRLNTDFGRSPYLDMGRAFGFAYGSKENGAFFSHMAVMYSYALYKRGFAREGFEVLQSIFKMGVDTKKSMIYPGVPEYFDINGRGRYHYLTGAASWFVLTMLTQAFGVCGRGGNLTVNPKLVKEQFNSVGVAGVECHFAGKRLKVFFENKHHLDYGEYKIIAAQLNGRSVFDPSMGHDMVEVDRSLIKKGRAEQTLKVTLGRG